MSPVVGGILYLPFEGGLQIGNGAIEGGVADLSSFSSNLVIPEFVNSLPVLKISSFAFYGRQLLSPVLPKSITCIEENAFGMCRLNQDSLVLPSCLTFIGAVAFASNGVRRFEVGSLVEFIGFGAFGDNPNLEIINVSIENQYFTAFQSSLYSKNMTVVYCVPFLIKDLNIPASIEIIETRSINHATATSIVLPHSIHTIKSDSFFRCPLLKTIYVMGNLLHLHSNILFSGSQVTSFYYYGTRVVSFECFESFPIMQIYVCNEYRSKKFGNNLVLRCGACLSFLKCSQNVKVFRSYNFVFLFTYVLDITI